MMLMETRSRLEKSGGDLQMTVSTLREGLESFEKGAEQMEGIYKRFESRLSQLEQEMAPMKDISSKLTVARRNIGKAVEKMEEINEYFLLEGELRGVIEGGVKGCLVAGGENGEEVLGGGVLEYLEEVQRLVRAQIYFRDWPQLVSQAEALKGLNELSDVARKECINEFNQLMGTLGPVVQYRGETNKYEACEALSEGTAYTVEIIGECLSLLGEEDGMMQSYKKSRTRTVATSLALWEERFEGNPAGVDARGDGYWLQTYLDYACKLAAGERALAEKALGVGGGGFRDFDKTAAESTFTVSRQSGAAHAHSYHSPVPAASKRDCMAEEAFAAVVVPVVRKLVAVVDTKLQSLDFKDGGEKASSKAKAFVTRGGKDALVQSNDGRGGWSGDIYIEALLSALEMAEAFSEYGEQLVVTLSEGLCSPSGAGGLATELTNLGKTLRSSCLQRCMDLLEGVKGDNTTRKNMQENAAVHVLTSNTLRAIKRIVPFRKSFNTLVESNKARVPWLNKAPPAMDTMGDSGHGVLGVLSADDNGAKHALPYFVEFVNFLISTLLDNLQQKSLSYNTGQLGSDAKRYLFLMNNAYYVLATSKHSFEALDALRAFGNNNAAGGLAAFRSPGGTDETRSSHHGHHHHGRSSIANLQNSFHGRQSRLSSNSTDVDSSSRFTAAAASPMTMDSSVSGGGGGGSGGASHNRTSSHTHGGHSSGGISGSIGGISGPIGGVPSPRSSAKYSPFSPRQSFSRFSRKSGGGGKSDVSAAMASRAGDSPAPPSPLARGGGSRQGSFAGSSSAYEGGGGGGGGGSAYYEEDGVSILGSGVLAVDLGASIGPSNHMMSAQQARSGGGGGMLANKQYDDTDANARLSIAMFLTSSTLWLLARSMREKFRAYADCIIQPLVPCVIDDVGPLDFQKKGSTIVTTDCSKKVKTKFASFNRIWEDTASVHKQLSVSDPTLKEELRITVKKQLISRYAIIHEKYSQVQFSKKKQFTFYIKYSPGQVEAGIDEMFNV